MYYITYISFESQTFHIRYHSIYIHRSYYMHTQNPYVQNTSDMNVMKSPMPLTRFLKESPNQSTIPYN